MEKNLWHCTLWPNGSQTLNECQFPCGRAEHPDFLGNISFAENTTGPRFKLKVFRKRLHPLPGSAIRLNIPVQMEAVAAQAERQAHRKAARNKLGSKRLAHWESCSEFCVHPFACSCLTTVLDASEHGRCAALPPLFAGSFLGVFRGVLVQLRFDDVWGLAPGQSAAPHWKPWAWCGRYEFRYH